MLMEVLEFTNTNLDEMRVTTTNSEKEQADEMEKLKKELKGKEGTIKKMASENDRLKKIHAIAVTLNNTNKRQEAEMKKLKAELQGRETGIRSIISEKDALIKKMKR